MWVSLFVSASAATGPLSVALANGFAFAAIASIFKADISPYIGLVRVCTLELRVSYFLVHIIPQCVGAILATIWARYCGPYGDLTSAVPIDAPGASAWITMVTDMFGVAFFLSVAVIAAHKDWRPAYALQAGLMFTAIQLAITPTYFGFDVFRVLFASCFGHWYENIWAHFVGPVIGVFIAIMIYWIFRADKVHDGKKRIIEANKKRL
jgi:glycerol uptake facilitator-like aquaporin